MAINIADSFNRTTAQPPFTGIIFADLTARDAYATTLRYEGMECYVLSESLYYSLVGGTDNADWIERKGGSGSGVISVLDLTERDAIPEESRELGMLVYAQDTQTYYTLKDGLENTDWTPVSFLDALFSDDVGSIVISARNDDSPPEGCLPFEQEYNAHDYPDLASHLWNSTQGKWKFGGTGSYPTGTFYTPKKGAFIRIFGGTLDPDASSRIASGLNGVTGNAIGTLQGHAFQTHTHIQNSHNHNTQLEGELSGPGGTPQFLGAKIVAYPAASVVYAATATNQNASGSGANSQASANETRPTNISFNAFIRYKPSGKGEKGDQGVPGEGIKIVADIAARNAIPSGERTEGMTVTVLDDGNGNQKDYWLKGGITNSDWLEKKSGGANAIHEVTNLISNPRGDEGITGWTYETYASNARPTGVPSTGASGLLLQAFSGSLSSLGENKFTLTKYSSGSAQGQAAAFVMPVPGGYRSSVLSVKVLYKTTSPDFIAGSLSDDSSLIWYCSQSSDGGSTFTMLEPSSFRIMTKGIPDTLQSYVQVGPDTTHLKLIAYVARTETTTWNLDFEASVSKTEYAYGGIITDWESYTPALTGFTVSGANALNSGKWRRVGDSVEIQISTRMGSTGTSSGIFYWGLPTGLMIDSNKLSGTSSGIRDGLNSAKWFDRSASQFKSVNSAAAIPGHIWLAVDGSANNIDNTLVPTNSDDAFTIRSVLPIQGWSSGAQLADGYEGRDVSCRMTLSANQAGVNPNNSYVKILFNNPTYNPAGMANPANSRIDIKSAGKYSIYASVVKSSANTLSSQYWLCIYKNGAETIRGPSIVPQAGTPTGFEAYDELDLVVGDYLEVYFYGVGNNSSSTLTFPNGMDTKFIVSKISGSSFMSPTATVAVEANNTSGFSVGNTISVTPTGWTKSVDTHNAFNAATGVFTAPEPGLYEFAGAYSYQTSAYVLNNVLYLGFINGAGTITRVAPQAVQSSSSMLMGGSISGVLIPLLQGETARPLFRNSRTAGATLLNTGTSDNWISIKKVK